MSDGTFFELVVETIFMAQKENKGGLLSNEQIEQDNRVKGKTEGPYQGMQDTGDKGVRHRGTDVQQRDGLPDEGQNEEE